MADEKLLTVREASIILDISEKEVMNLAESGVIPAYKVGGVYLRFKKEQLAEYQRLHKKTSPKSLPRQKNSFSDGINDFVYFNDFYIFAFALILILLMIIARG
jgi:excisionase family DNA binding protein